MIDLIKVKNLVSILYEIYEEKQNITANAKNILSVNIKREIIIFILLYLLAQNQNLMLFSYL